jgi:hypothetical protein
MSIYSEVMVGGLLGGAAAGVYVLYRKSFPHSGTGAEDGIWVRGTPTRFVRYNIAPITGLSVDGEADADSSPMLLMSAVSTVDPTAALEMQASSEPSGVWLRATPKRTFIYSPVISGGFRVSGSGNELANHVPQIDPTGARLGGNADVLCLHIHTPTGGVRVRGTPFRNAVYEVDISGGVWADGSPVYGRAFNGLAAPAAGVFIDGTAFNVESIYGNGGVWVKPTDLVSFRYVSVTAASAGAVLNGSADVGWTYNHTMSSGVVVNGAAGAAHGIYGNGGLHAAGSSSVRTSFGPTPSGGVWIRGHGIVRSGLYGAGGAFAEGSSDSYTAFGHEPSGGLLAGGSTTTGIAFGPPPTGGVWCRGTSRRSLVINYSVVAKGVVVAGTAPLFTAIPMNGGVVVNGTARITTDYITFGGALAGTHAVDQLVIASSVSPNGVLTGGLGDAVSRRLFVVVATGDAQTGGSSVCGTPSLRYNALGSIGLTGEAEHVELSFTSSRRFLWRILTTVEGTFEFLYNVGQLRIFWYRVVSKGIDPSQTCPIQGNPCCQKYVVTIHARTLGELCTKLSRRKFKFPIESVERFSRPAENSQLAADAAAGNDNVCQKLIPVEVCGIPECADFCVDQDLRASIGFRATAQINSFFAAESSGHAFIGGTSAFRMTKNLPQFTFVSSGGMSLGGSSVHAPNSFVGRGGASLGGHASSQFSRWQYIGGVWPNETEIRFGTENAMAVVQANDAPWQLIDRVNAADGLYSQVDVSFLKRSELMVVSGFGLTVPQGSDVMGLVVNIKRLATQVGIRDLEVYLMRAGERISDNLADPSVDWPLIATEREYGSDAFGSGTLWRDPDDDHYLGPLTPDDLNDPTFGVGIRVRQIADMPAAIAKIDYVDIKAFYEDPNGSIVRFGGTATASSPSYHYESSGKSVLSSLVTVRQGFRYASNGKNSTGGCAIELESQSYFTFNEFGSGGVRVSSSAKVTPYLETGSGGARVSSSAKVTPYLEIGSGGVRVTGSARRQNFIHYVTTGGPSLASLTFVPIEQFRVTSSGGIVLGSNFRLRSNYFRWLSDGNVVALSGTAGQRPGNVSPTSETIGFLMTVRQVTASFLTDVDQQNATGLSGSVNKCGCLAIPLTVELTQNLAKDNLFAKFLIRNNYQIATILKLRYNVTNDSWQCNLHYRGNSADSNTPEAWDLVFELQCTDLVGGIGIGTTIWKLAAQVTRKRLGDPADFRNESCGRGDSRRDLCRLRCHLEFFGVL